MHAEKRKLAFVDMEFHKKTKSGDFLRELFCENFTIHDFWHDGTRKSASRLMKELVKFEYIFFFQTLMPYKDIICLRNKNIKIIWAPMYDGLPMNSYFWNKIASSKIKIICFSGAITQKAKAHNIDHHSFRYFKKPLQYNSGTSHQGLNIFFWYRGNIAFYDWIRFVDSLPINKIVYLPAPDPNFKKEIISEADIKKYNIQIAKQGFVKREEYIELMQDCDIYICPRKQEGIGMTIVEALAMGKFLVGYNDYTMIDYIVDKKNGFLFDKNTKKTIDLNDIEASKDFRRKLSIQGFEEWQASAKIISGLFSGYKYPASRSVNLANSYFSIVEFFKGVLKRVLGYTSA